MLDPVVKIPVVKLRSSAFLPFVVQALQAQTWDMKCSMHTLEAALEKAQELASVDPATPLRIEHHAGELFVTEQLPPWLKHESGLKPYDVALWSGVGEPPALGSKVTVTINGIGPGVVAGYAVHDGWLGVMVQADQETRPLWHRKDNPDNRPSLVYGSEMLIP